MMSSFFPTMKMKTNLSDDVDDMYSVHGHAGNLCREDIVEGLREIINSWSTCQAAQPVSIADYGTADGRASLSLVNEMIGIIQRRLGEKQAVLVYYNDQPMNDFNLLSNVILGGKQDPGLAISDSVYPVMVPKTMYKQCLPDNSVDLAISAVATQYLSKQVCQIKHGIFMKEADEEEQNLMREQGKADWRAFIISRGRELKPGGYLVTLNISLDEKGQTSFPIDKGVTHLGVFVSDMAREGIISQEEYLSTNLNSHYMRTASDFKEPFSNDIPEVKELGLELLSVKLIKHSLKDPVYDIVNKDDTEKLEYSRKVVASVYPWMHHVLYGGLSNSRTEEEKQTIIDQYFSRLQMYAFHHSDHKPHVTFTEVVVKKSHII